MSNSKSSRTPGDWYISMNPYMVACRPFIGDPMVKIAECGGRSAEEKAGNAILVAISPDMLSALERIADAQPRPLKSGDFRPDAVEDLQRTARHALTAIRGTGQRKKGNA